MKLLINGYQARQFNLIADSERATYTVGVKLPHRITKEEMSISYYSRHTRPMERLSDFYYEHLERRCGHDYDCCGCWFTNLIDAKRKGRTITFKISAARNY